MKKHLTFLALLFVSIGYSQTNSLNQLDSNKQDSVTFVSKVDFEKMSKDGIWMNGYVVNIDYYEAKKLDGSTIEVSGVVSIVKGVDLNDKEVSQRREEDTKYITRPTFKIIETKHE